MNPFGKRYRQIRGVEGEWMYHDVKEAEFRVYKRWKRARAGLRRLAVLAVVGGILFGVYWAAGALVHKETGTGIATGYVTAVETDGWFWKTTYVYFKTSAESTQEDHYCVVSPSVRAQLDQAAATGQRVELQFTNHALWSQGCAWTSGSTIRAVRVL